MADPDAIPQSIPRPLAWLDRNWPFAGTVAAAFLLALLPLVLRVWGSPLVCVYALLLAYLVHQMEEHYADRFRQFVNATLAGGADALTPRATMWINVGGVWGVYVVTLLLAGLVDAGIGLVAVYTTLVNALAHIAVAVALRRSNPGLWTAVVLFIPIGVLGWRVVGAASGLGWEGHLLGIGVALLIHAAMVVHIGRRARAIGAQHSLDSILVRPV